MGYGPDPDLWRDDKRLTTLVAPIQISLVKNGFIARKRKSPLQRRGPKHDNADCAVPFSHNPLLIERTMMRGLCCGQKCWRAAKQDNDLAGYVKPGIVVDAEFRGGDAVSGKHDSSFIILLRQ